MASFNKFRSFVEALAKGAHDLSLPAGGDVLKIALTNAANPPANTNTVLANLTQISYANIVTDMAVVITASEQTAGKYMLKIENKTWEADDTVPAFRYIVIYNDTAANDELVCWYDYGSEVVMNNGDTFTVQFDQVDGVLTIE